jgi:hypothetical protein
VGLAVPIPSIDPISSGVQSLAATVLPEVLRAAGVLLFQTPDLTAVPEIQGLTRTTLAVADALLTLFLVYGGFRVITSGDSEARYALKSILSKAITAAVMANASLLICSTLVALDNGLVGALVGTDPARSGWTGLTSQMQSANLLGGILDSLIALAAGLLVVVLAVIYIARDLILVVLTVAAPLALMTGAVPDIADLAGTWWRAYVATLFMQVGHALLVAVGADLLVHPGWLGTGTSTVISGLIIIALFYVMVRLPFHLYQWAFGRPVSQHPVVQRVVTVVRTAATAATAAAL